MCEEIFKISGRTALITGASSGIGKSIAELYSQNGANVVLLARRKDRIEQLAAEIEAGNGVALPVACDVACDESVVQAVHTAVQRFGRIDILVNSAGITEKSGDITFQDRRQWENVIGTNLTGTYTVCRETAAIMKKNHYGKIINIASMAAFMGLHNQAGYVASKSGVAGLTRALAVELGEYGITVNAIAPGYILTEMTTEGSSGHRYFKSRSVLNTAGTPQDLHGAALLLASDASRFMTGTVVTVDGGVTANL